MCFRPKRPCITRWIGGCFRRHRQHSPGPARRHDARDRRGETIEALNLLFRVSDKFESSFDRRTGCSYGFSKQIVEGKRQVNTDLKFDYSRHTSTQVEKNLVSGITKHEEAQIPGCVTDLMSGIFYSASQPIQVSQNFRCHWLTHCIPFQSR